MHKFTEYLNEGRQAPLYHATYFRNLFTILGDNIIKATTEHKSDDLIQPMDKGRATPFNDKVSYISGVSLTRSKRFASGFRRADQAIIMELDQVKLAHNYKMIPVQWFRGSVHIPSGESDFDSKNLVKIGSRMPSTTKNSGPFGPHLGEMNEYEEFVISKTGISPLRRYLTGFWATPGTFSDIHMYATEEYKRDYAGGGGDADAKHIASKMVLEIGLRSL